MASHKPAKPPVFDAATYTKRLHENVKTPPPASAPFAVFDPVDDDGTPIGFPRFVNWIRGLRDTVNANAVFVDDLKRDVDALRGTLTQGQSAQNTRISALEAQSSAPFPGSG